MICMFKFVCLITTQLQTYRLYGSNELIYALHHAIVLSCSRMSCLAPKVAHSLAYCQRILILLEPTTSFNEQFCVETLSSTPLL